MPASEGRSAFLPWGVGAVLVLAAFLRFYQLAAFPPGLYVDEAMDGNDARQALETHRFQVFYPEDNGREGLYVNTAALGIALFGNQAWALRLPAAVFGVLTVGGLYLLGAELISAPAGLLAAFFLATSFWHMVFSRMAFRAIAAPLFLVWGFYLLLVALRRARGGRAWIAWMALAGAVYGLGFYTYPAYRVTPLLLLAIWIAQGRQMPRVASAVWIFAGAAAAVATPLAVYFAGHPGAFWGRASLVSVVGGPRPAVEIALNCWRTARMLFTRGDHNWRHNVAWQAELFWPVAICMVIGLRAAWQRQRTILLWLAAGMAPAVLATEAPHSLRAILMLPPVCLLAALGAQQVYSWLVRVTPVRIVQTAAIAVALALCYQPYHSYFDVWARHPNTAEALGSSYTELARRIAAAPPEQLKLVVATLSGNQAAGLPVELQPVMFLTGSYTASDRRDKRIRYVVGQPTDTALCRETAQRNPSAAIFCVP
jgi:4-amino-4-deoxy-L-arabinose transferase-like glycosyltransferase